MVVVLRRLSLEDYGPFTKLDIELGDITIFVGRNNTGKSTALEAITLLLSSINNFRVITSSIDVLSNLGLRSRYLINLRSNKGVAVVSGDVVSQGMKHSIEVRVIRGINGLGDLRDNAVREIIRSITELTPTSQKILIEAFRRVLRERKDGKDITEAFKEFVDGVISVLSNRVDDVLVNAVFVSTYVDGELLNAALLPLSEVRVSEDIIGKLKELGLSSSEARRLLNIQLGKVISGGRIILTSKKLSVEPIRVQHLSLHPFLIDDLPPDKQTELIDLLRKEVRYFYDYRGGQVILNFDGSRVSVPYALMGDGFKALVRMLGLIVMGVDVTLIDEPEAHLHPGFMEVITKYMVEPRFLDRIQFVMATQSLEFLDYLLRAAEKGGVLGRVKLVRLYLMPNGSIDYEQLSGEEAYEEMDELKSDLRGP
ncbi:ATP-binding protein [Vulcanisaeta distributa]|uniref:ATPase AAA-type core domain-containing protein n=1 Tax=Vulcanisaeta distributa (strain DSM 14429 / JCM 11212 / NBRC 100878 / IC-017) TaxID=572478 RepID=E1QUR1_VULDI|nr:ATP-binding protein [Vulcanisaeta distributa]ADN49914.1 hypothetical protein Vdis_0515 [Vulcanisaeta distributa DSM 14429]